MQIALQALMLHALYAVHFTPDAKLIGLFVLRTCVFKIFLIGTELVMRTTEIFIAYYNRVFFALRKYILMLKFIVPLIY